MLRSSYDHPLSALDEQVFAALVPPDHYLRCVKAALDFERYRAMLAPCYSASQGRPADDPVLMVKLEVLQFHYGLSDREVIAETQVNVAYRYFLDLGLQSTLPHPSLLSVFRTRLGPERHQQLLDDVVAQARSQGLVKDRLRLKDATHVIADIAIPSAIQLVAQARQRLLAAVRPFAPARVAQEEEQAAQVRLATSDVADVERLAQRVAHLRLIVTWVDALVTEWELAEAATESAAAQQAVRVLLALAHKVLADRADPAAGDEVVSLVDPDARRGKHGHFYIGYLLDVASDADSGLITAVNLLPANGDEGADAQLLIAQEEAAQGNDVQALSIDGAGWRGELLRAWQDPAGLHLDVFVPPPAQPPPPPVFPAELFTLDDTGTVLTCPGGQHTRKRRRTRTNSGWTYTFPTRRCQACPLRSQCLVSPAARSGRAVVKNDYIEEYAAARAKAETAAYTEVRRTHRAIERKIADVVRWHGGRRMRYRGRRRGLIQYVLTAVVVNVKRMVHLLRSAPIPCPCAASTTPVALTPAFAATVPALWAVRQPASQPVRVRALCAA